MGENPYIEVGTEDPIFMQGSGLRWDFLNVFYGILLNYDWMQAYE